MSFAQAAARTNGGATNLGRTTNGAATNLTTHSACLDLFGKAGAMRGNAAQAVALFRAAYAENRDIALRTLLYLRDARGGAGARQVFRDILSDLCNLNQDDAARIVVKTPELGRWDDVFSTSGQAREFALALYEHALSQDDALAAKWAKRKGRHAEDLRRRLGLAPKTYRDLIVGLSKTVEQQMCARDWANINFSHVPSIAAKMYQKAFAKRAGETYSAYREALKKADPKVKVNAGAIFPHDVLVGLKYGDETVASAQWKALPDFLGTHDGILPLLDLSASMNRPLGTDSSTVRCRDVSLALGLYIAERQRGAFHNIAFTFSSETRVVTLSDSMTLKAKLAKLHDTYAGSTNLESAFRKILEIAIANRIAPSEMPKKLMIFSDMEFNEVVGPADAYERFAQRVAGIAPTATTGMGMCKAAYAKAGYAMPSVIFWNLYARIGNNPVTIQDDGTAMVAGYSPSLLKAILSCKSFSPENVMHEAVMSDRYKID